MLGLATEIYRANSARDKTPHIETIIERLQVLEFQIRLCTGVVHRPFYRSIRSRTLNKMRAPLVGLRSSLNSYLGIVRWGKSYRVRKTMGSKLHSLFLRFYEEAH